MDENHSPETVEAVAVTQLGSTFAERAAARAKSEKAVKPADVEDKAVKSTESKSHTSKK